MSIERYSGVSSEILLNNTTDIIQLIGTGKNNNESAKVFINGDLVSQTVSRGFNIYIYDEYLNLLNTYNFHALSTNNVNNFVSTMYSISPRRFFSIVSYDDIKKDDTIDEMFTTLGGLLWFDMWDEYHFETQTSDERARIPYAAFGCTELGITHETYGNHVSGASNPNAIIDMSVGEYDSHGSMGFGRAVFELPSESLNNETKTNNFNYSNHNHSFRLVVRAKSNTNNGTVTITDTPPGGSELSVETYSISVDSNLYRDYVLDVPVRDVNATYTVERSTTGTMDVKHLLVNRSRTDGNDQERISRVVKRNGGFSVRDVVFSNTGYDMTNDAMLNNMVQEETFFLNTDSNKIIGKTNKPSATMNGTFESDFLEVNNNKDYCVLFFMQCSNPEVNVKVSITAYDASQNPTSIQVIGSSSPTILMNETDVATNEPVYMEQRLLAKTAPSSVLSDYSENMYGDIADGGIEHEFVSKETARMTSDVSYIKVTIETNKQVDITLPVICELKYALSKDSVFIGGINF